MKKAVHSSVLPSASGANGAAGATPSAFAPTPPTARMEAVRPAATPASPIPAAAPPYVDPYLFEVGYYASRAEYEDLTRTEGTRIQLRAEAEKSPSRRRS